MESNRNESLQQLDHYLKNLIGTSIGRRNFLISLPFLLSSCATKMGSDRHREGDNAGQEAALTVDEERQMTAEVLPQMQKDYPPIQDPFLQTYISSLGNNIVTRNGPQGNPYQYNFTIVGVPYINAFALPAGTVFVTAPLLASAETEAELAGVVGHEIGHIKARHTAERMAQAKNSQKKSILYSIGGGLLGGAAGFAVGKMLCPPKDTKCLVKASGLGLAAGAGGALLIQKYAFMANSREDEMEADRIGFRTSVAAGYSKDHVGTFYAKLLKMEEDREKNNNPIMATFADAMSTHPPSRERVQQMQQMSSEAPQSADAKVTSADFDKARALAEKWVKENPPKQG